jgi:prepilin-type N-terminal cleavage/methylation domain-containing protein
MNGGTLRRTCHSPLPPTGGPSRRKGLRGLGGIGIVQGQRQGRKLSSTLRPAALVRVILPRGLPSGVTLLEVMLTLAVLVLMAGIAWPVLSRAFENQRLKKSADLLRAEWTHARVQAMSTGYVYIFQFTPGEQRYSTYRRVGSEVELSADGQFQAVDVGSLQPFGKEQSLPEGIRFAAGEVLWDTRAEMYNTDRTTFLSPDQGWSGPVFFYPDGTTSTARITLENERGRRIDISLRGLTGMVSISDIYTAEEPQP